MRQRPDHQMGGGNTPEKKWGEVHGVDEFGASGAYWDTFEKYGFTEERATEIERSLLE